MSVCLCVKAAATDWRWMGEKLLVSMESAGPGLMMSGQEQNPTWPAR